MRKWTNQEDKKLKTWLTRAKQPLSLEIAAERLGRTVRGVLKRIERLKAKGLWDAIAGWLVLTGLLWATPVQAQDPAQKDSWTAAVVGNDDMLSLRFGTRPWGEKTEIGLYGVWQDSLQPGDADALGAGVFATYDVAQGEFSVLKVNVPITWYIGGTLGFLSPTEDAEWNKVDPTASLLTGLSFGGEKVRIGVEAQYALSRDLWKELADVDPQGELLLCLQYRF